MKKILFPVLLLTIFSSFGQDQKVLNDCTVTYDVSVIDAKADPGVAAAMQGATKVVYIRSNKVRTDFITSTFNQTTLQDSKSDSTIILREFDKNKFISFLSGNKRKELGKKYEHIKFANSTDKKVILGYQCVKTIATLPDGSTYNIFYAPSIIAINNDFEAQFKDLPGFVLEYEAQTDDGKVRIKYTASKMTLIPVPIAKFDIPLNGYRVL